ncbi:MAG: hypothetical protein R8G66_13150 [Cytophagales bacterium]|nr:hypothetical protein [Cytophagales bacterium]
MMTFLKKQSSRILSWLRQPFVFSIIFLGLLTSCSEDIDLTSSSLLRIYDHSDGELGFHPIDIGETADGYIILTGRPLDQVNFEGVQLITTDLSGNFRTTENLPDNLVVPTGDLLLSDSVFRFFAMDRTTLRVEMVSIQTNLGNLQTTRLNNLFYPLSASVNSSGNFLLVSYDPIDLLTVLSEISPDGTILNSVGYTIGVGEDVEQRINEHFLERQSRLPFFCGEAAPGQYFFNGFYNFSLSTVFTDFGNTPTGVIQGQSDNGGLKAIDWISGNLFSVIRYQFNETYLLPVTQLLAGSTSSSVELLASRQAELRDQTPATITPYGDQHVILAAETESREVVLYFYNLNSEELTGTEIIGFANPFTLSQVRVDTDNNLLILGTTYVSGRFERIYLQKIMAKDLQSHIN